MTLNSLEALESRRLLATWSASDQLVDLDAAVAAFPNINGAGITIAQIDTGIDYTHPSLGGGIGSSFKVRGGRDFVDNDDDPMDTNGHGTEVAGVLAANGFTQSGIFHQGIAPNARLVALRIASGSEGVADSLIEKAVQWVEDNYQAYGISVVNISFGYGRYASIYDNPTLSDNFSRLANLGIFVVGSSGNGGISSGTGVTYPASDANVIAAGAVNTSDGVSTFTQRGRTLDLLAPGEGIVTTARGGGFATGSGTSFASPYIAGTAALLKQVDPTLKNDDLLSIFRASGARIDDPSTQAYPRLNIFNAVSLAQARKPNAASNVGAQGINNDLAFDEQGVLHLAYYDHVAHTIKYATRSTGGAWSSVQAVDTTGHDVGAYLSLAIDPMGKPSIAYYDAAVADLEYAHFDGKTWQRTTLDSGKTVGQFVSLAFDDAGEPIVAYYRKTSADLRVMHHDSSTSSWKRYFVDTGGDVGRFASIDVSSAGVIGVAYADVTNGDLKYAQFDGTTWTPELADNLRGVAFVSFAFDGSDPAISYYDAYPADLKYATKPTTTWQAKTIGKSGAQGLYTNLWFDNDGLANIVYYNRKANTVFRLRESGTSWAADIVGVGGGEYASAAANIAGDEAAYAWWKEPKDRLVLGALA